MTESVATSSSKPLNVLFVCTHNRCRSILCEALTRHLSHGQIKAFSAGSQPSGHVHPDTLKHLNRRGVDTTELHSTAWEAHENVTFDAVITVCDSAAGEPCPVWLGDAAKVHWSLTDPTKIENEKERERAFDAVITLIQQRINSMMSSEIISLRGNDLRDALQALATKE